MNAPLLALVQKVCKTSIKTEIMPVIGTSYFFSNLLLCIGHVQRFLDVTLSNQEKLLL